MAADEKSEESQEAAYLKFIQDIMVDAGTILAHVPISTKEGSRRSCAVLAFALARLAHSTEMSLESATELVKQGFTASERIGFGSAEPKEQN